MSGQEQPPKRSDPPRTLPFLRRTQAMGSTGWEAYTIGFTLVGCIVAGAGLGWFLDKQFGTSYWLPILFLVGVAGGFREMMQTLNRISQNQTKARKEQANRETANLYTPPSPDTQETAPVQRERLFSVPPPPLEGEVESKQQESEPETTDEIIARLLAEADEDDERGKRRQT